MRLLATVRWSALGACWSSLARSWVFLREGLFGEAQRGAARFFGVGVAGLQGLLGRNRFLLRQGFCGQVGGQLGGWVRVSLRGGICWLALLGVGCHQHGKDLPSNWEAQNEPLQAGAEIYRLKCAQCHLPSGEGVPGVNPPIVGTPLVLEDADRLIALTLHGMHGPVEVRGQTYNSVMPAWKHELSPAQIAAVLTYIRQAWGNDAGPIDEFRVKQIRSDTFRQNSFYTIEELREF